MTDNHNTPNERPTDFRESPVPNDKHLEGDLLPFTAFGQFGEGSMDLRVFEQDIYWVNVKGEPFLLAEMEQDYLFNVMNMLFTDVEHFHLAYAQKATVELAMDIQAGRENVVTDADDVKRRVQARMGSESAVGWLNGTPLAKRIQALLGW